ncbi:hypothetical protein [Pseudomonas sp. TH49]|uniref:hypothetical protein n=1 Tax=Pseudomonas sp. TH49 TaxID=2796413 RepID=UPI001F5BCC57|nr:hypothetical protein [Pseudomonas sp. TH49]
MAKQTINLGTAPTGVGGDTPRSAFTKTQSNFDELYAADAVNYKRSNILGTVSQSSGVPTGAIIENLVNANGRAIKFADGTMVCISPQLLCPGPTAAFGALFISPAPIAWAYPAAFVGSVPALTASTANTVQLIVCTLTANFTNGTFAFYHPFSTAGSLTIYAMAVGRWF